MSARWLRLRKAFSWGIGLALMWTALPLLSPGAVQAHEVPPTVTVQAFLRPEGDVLRLIVRVPLNSIRDFDFPTFGPGYLDIGAAEPMLYEGAGLWVVDYVHLYENGELIGPPRLVSARASLPSDPSFQSYESALAHVLTGARLANEIELYWGQAMLDLVVEYPIQSANSRFSIDSELAHLGVRTTTVLRFQLPGGDERLFQFIGFAGLVDLDPSWWTATMRFVRLGFLHILEGIDHLLFILCLVIPIRRIVPLVAVITSFTVAHSITLGAAALGYAPDALWFPSLIESLIALSIVYMAFENIVGVKLRRRWLVAFAFGLVHGFGFSFLLQESLQYAGGHLLMSLLAFNIGVEFGQIFILLIAVPLLILLFRHVVAERVGIILLSALIAHTAWHWMAERWAEFSEYPLQWPVLDALFLLGAIRMAMALLVVGGIAWLLSGLFGRFEALKAADPE